MASMYKRLAVLALLVGCGDDGVNKLADAPPPPDDAAVDAPTSGVVTLTIVQDGTPRDGVDVYFLAANNTLVAKVPTNAQGVASATMGLGGSVTAIDPFLTKSSGHELQTFVGVKPGDNLHLTTGQTAAQNTPLNVTVTLPMDAFATQYDVSTSCGSISFSTSGSGSGGTTVGGPATFYGCGATVDVLLETYDTQGAPLGSIFKAGVAITEGGTLDLSADAFVTPVPTGTINWSNIPAGYTSLVANTALATPKGFLRTGGLNPAAVAAGATTATFPRPAIATGTLLVMSEPQPTNFIGRHTVLDWTPQTAATTALDYTGALLGTYSTAPSVSAATRTVTWTAGTGATPDFVVANLSASRIAGQAQQFWSWAVVLPYASTTFTLPTLPTEIAQFNFEATDTVNLDELTTAKVPGGYDAVRADILSSSGPEEFAKSATGRIVLEQLDFRPTARRLAKRSGWAQRVLPARK